MRSSQRPRSRANGSDDSRLSFRRNPVGLLFSAGPWRSAGYLASYLVVSTAAFVVTMTVCAAVLVLAVTVAAVPLLIAAAAATRGAAEAVRAVLRQVFTRPVHGHYPPPSGPGLWRQAVGRWREGTTWRDLALLLGLWPVLFTLAAFVLAIWAVLLAGLTLPLWYAHVSGSCVGFCADRNAVGVMIGSFPHSPYGHDHFGLYVHTLSSALLAAAGSAVLFVLFNYVLVAAARLHGRVTRALLRQSADPLAPAMAVLAGPRPLGPLLGTAPIRQDEPDDRLLR